MNIRRNGRHASFKLVNALTLFSVPLILTCFLTKEISTDKQSSFQGQSLEIQFTKFSPAYAAFEDEFLFSKTFQPTPLQAGLNNEAFLRQKESEQKSLPTLPTPVTLAQYKETPQHKQALPEGYEEEFTGLAALSSSQSQVAATNLKVLPSTKKTIPKKETLIDDGEYQPNFNMNFGPMVASVDKKNNLPKSGKKRSPSPAPKTKPNQTKDGLVTHAHEDQIIADAKAPNNLPKDFNIAGSIELREGLAFVGSMEVSWVIDDQEVTVGAINIPDAAYEITVNDLIGDIVISLYDENDDLIGEGIASLDELAKPATLDQIKINVRPIDWDKAGEVIHVHSINSHDRPIPGAEVQLYAYNDSIETNKEGEIRFVDWKKSNSRTLALASKEGFRDSVFLIDSKKFSKVLLFQNSYIDAFFNWIEDLGILGVKDMGTVYGAIVSGNRSLEGFQVRLDKETPLYFNKAYFASNTQTSTGQNGLFAFTGLEDGDYELYIEKDGIVIDRRIVPVEQGKISPLFIDLKRKKKRLEFFDPHNLDQKPKEVAVQFFDGEDSLSLNSDSQLVGQVVGGSDPGLIDYASGTGAIASTFVTRQRGFERVAVLNKQILDSLLKSKDYDESNGLAVGYIQSEVLYEVGLEESDVQNIIYFNAKGQEIDHKEEPAYGFVIHGFSKGLHTLSVETIEDKTLIMTDLIFSDHQSISVIHSDIEPL